MTERDEVEVRSRFDGAWAGGFEVAGAEPDNGGWRFWVRRRADGLVLPDTFAAHELRPPHDAREVVADFERRFLTDPDTDLPPPLGDG